MVRPIRRSPIFFYSVAVLTVIIALLLTLVFKPLLASTLFVFFFVAVTGMTWYGGIGPGLVTMVLSVLALDYFVLVPLQSLTLFSGSNLLRMGLFVLVTLAIAQLNTKLHQTKRQLEISLNRLQQSEERYRRIVETASEGIWILDEAGRTRYVNQRMAQMLGCSPEAMLDRSFFDWFDQGDRPEGYKTLTQPYPGYAEQWDGRFRRSDQSLLWAIVSMNSIFDDQGQFQGTHLMLTDVTDRQQTQERLQLSLEAGRMGFWDWNLLTNELVRSDNLEEIYGVSPTQVKETLEGSLNLVHPEDRERVKAAIAQAVAETTPYSLEFRIQPSPDQIRWILGKGRVFKDAQGRALRITGIAMDISDRKQTEESLKQTQQRFETFMNYSPVAAYFKDEAGRYIYVNPILERLWDRPEEEWLGQTDADLFPQAIAQELQAHDRAVLETDQALEFVETTEQRDGIHYWISWKFPMREPSGRRLVAGISLDITDRKRTQEERDLLLADLESQQQLLSAVLQQMPAGAIVAEAPSGQLVLMNQQVREILGISVTPLNTIPDYLHTSYQIFHPDGKPYNPAALPLARSISTGEMVVEEEMEITRTDGTRVTVLANSGPIRNAEGKIVAAVVTFYDITAQKSAQAEINGYADIVKNIQVGLTVWQLTPGEEPPSFELISANPAASQVAGRDLNRAVGMRIETLFPHLVKTSRLFELREVLNSSSARDFPEVIYRDDAGGERYCSLKAFPLSSRCLGIAYEDITDRKQAQFALRESEQRFRTMADAAPVYIWLSGIDQQYYYFNQPWLEFTGRTLEQEIGKGWLQGVHPEDRQFCVDTYGQAFELHQSFEIEYRLRRYDGEYRWMLDRAVPRFSPDGRFEGYVGSSIDISDRKIYESEIKRLNATLERRVSDRTAQLEAANQELESFAYSVSHDLRAPLRHISGFVNLLRKRIEPSLDENSQRYLNIIVQSTHQAEELIDNLLAFSRMARSQMRFIKIDTNQLVKEVWQSLEMQRGDRKIIWEVAFLPPVKGEPTMLRLVFQNLLDNAIKYSQRRQRAEITVGFNESDLEFIFFVRDNGIGFDMRYAHKLFGVFQRLHSNPDYAGTGIGLANVRRIIHRHGGRTWAEGEVDFGATFYFSLPKEPEQEQLESPFNPLGSTSS
ncbi:PAS domain S-box protein [Laspinema olomoucense]|uniref:PAS domain S-box protein n=1 Tax=Laspinema olomoucense TaxID=3231600 RepID=UPI0021BB966D|nr:PAS domain S-box protein [Laspinema sp. D3a]MCT7988396.1 PAS domain S-box protein [Laspinema sp. D3a]